MNKYTKPDFKSSAVINIDTQCDTLDGQPVEITGTSAVLPKMKIILDTYRKKKMPIIHIVRIYKRDGSNVDLCRKLDVESGKSMFLENSSGCELAPDIFNDAPLIDSELLLSGKIQKLHSNEIIIYKSRWGAFYNTPLESYLRERGINTLVFIGCNFPNCPRTSIYEASERDFKIVLVQDAISGLYVKGIDEMLNVGVYVDKTENIKKKIDEIL